LRFYLSMISIDFISRNLSVWKWSSWVLYTRLASRFKRILHYGMELVGSIPLRNVERPLGWASISLSGNGFYKGLFQCIIGVPNHHRFTSQECSSPLIHITRVFFAIDTHHKSVPHPWFTLLVKLTKPKVDP
jgi:hypothetical protein